MGFCFGHLNLTHFSFLPGVCPETVSIAELRTCDATAASGTIGSGQVCVIEKHSSTYTVFMRNITLSVDDDVLAAVRRHAADRNSSVNALVREYLTNLAAHEDRAKRARARLRQLSRQSQGRLGKKTWTREELHDR